LLFKFGVWLRYFDVREIAQCSDDLLRDLGDVVFVFLLHYSSAFLRGVECCELISVALVVNSNLVQELSKVEFQETVALDCSLEFLQVNHTRLIGIDRLEGFLDLAFRSLQSQVDPGLSEFPFAKFSAGVFVEFVESLFQVSVNFFIRKNIFWIDSHELRDHVVHLVGDITTHVLKSSSEVLVSVGAHISGGCGLLEGFLQ